MSDDQTLKQIVVGSIVALIGAIAGAIFNLLFAGKLSLDYWWVWVFGGALLALFVFGYTEDSIKASLRMARELQYAPMIRVL